MLSCVLRRSTSSKENGSIAKVQSLLTRWGLLSYLKRLSKTLVLKRVTRPWTILLLVKCRMSRCQADSKPKDPLHKPKDLTMVNSSKYQGTCRSISNRTSLIMQIDNKISVVTLQIQIKDSIPKEVRISSFLATGERWIKIATSLTLPIGICMRDRRP